MELRTALIGLLVLLCMYIAWLVMRWRRVQRQARSGDVHANLFRDVDRFGAIPVGGQATGIRTHHSDEGPVGLTIDTEDDDSVVSLTSRPTAHAAEAVNAPAAGPARSPRPSEPDASGFGFDALLEVRQMRHLVDELRVQHGKLSEELVRLREEMLIVRAASRVAPAYAEAVSMVQRGLDAEAIAERCGISVAEAELVRALSEPRGLEDESSTYENERDAQQEDQHGNRGDIHG